MSKNGGSIICLYQIVFRQCDITRSLNLSRQLVPNSLKRFKELGHEGDRARCGRKRTVNTSRNREQTNKRIC